MKKGSIMNKFVLSTIILTAAMTVFADDGGGSGNGDGGSVAVLDLKSASQAAPGLSPFFQVAHIFQEALQNQSTPRPEDLVGVWTQSHIFGYETDVKHEDFDEAYVNLIVSIQDSASDLGSLVSQPHSSYYQFCEGIGSCQASTLNTDGSVSLTSNDINNDPNTTEKVVLFRTTDKNNKPVKYLMSGNGLSNRGICGDAPQYYSNPSGKLPQDCIIKYWEVLEKK